MLNFGGAYAKSFYRRIGTLPVFAILRLNNGGDSLMLQRLLGHTTLMMTNTYCQAAGRYDATVESGKRCSLLYRLHG